MADHRLDVAIVGAGVIGAATAYELARSTALRVAIYDRALPGCAASGAAAGVLGVGSAAVPGGALWTARRISAGQFPELVAALHDETGLDLDYRRGLLSVAFCDADAAALHERVQRRRRQGIACECLERTHVRTIEPEIAPTAVSGAWFPDDATIDSQRLVAAAMRAAAQRGVKAFFGVAFESLRTTERGIALRGPTLAVEAATVIIAAGAWSARLLASAGVKLPLRPAHGEMAALKPRGWQVRHAITDGSGYLVPRAGGELLVGSTLQLLGFDQRVTANGLSTLRAHAARLVPRTCAAPLVRAWAGLRPCSTIRRPIIGRLPALPNVILATGHHRNGVVLAPITARVVGDLIAGRPPSVPLAPFKFRRH